MDLLKELTETNGAPGFEHPIRSIMKREIDKTGASLVYDHMGSIFGQKKGPSSGPKIMLAGHMDEVAFMISEVTKDGYLRFVPLGGWWDQVILSQRVHILTEKKTFTGVVGSKPPHILTAEERKKVVPMREMFIDIGANSADQVKEWGIRVGDPIMPICPFEIMPDNDTILAKALDNRAGCYLALEVLKQLKDSEHPNSVYCGATVQEEVGLRGAATAPYAIEPDLAVAMDVGIAQDGPGDNSNKAKLGAGPLITFLDSSMVPHVPLRNLVMDIAEKNNIPYQVDVMLGGGTDAGRFHLFKKGVPSIVIGVASRYIHSHVSMVSKSDLENTVKLLVAFVKEMDENKMKSLIDF
ncbi:MULTISPECIES: M42 family metallopeptidase [Fictibacillus]|uniref:Peptidase M28 n=1 Tax=Fictibacillus enclensis TaxID=1017270 RepID=A0A0V8J8H2_9BACL|nr:MULTISPECIES: M42 family metallopeptidase [Fictibacillus]KSU83315.1 peptidase M28 [Fictibacillus enclensis]RXZ02061.1 M42 family peptidase [Fictibacillus sp. S7]SCC13441.1 endoglucanase [Fictibacillus enclensis]